MSYISDDAWDSDCWSESSDRSDESGGSAETSRTVRSIARALEFIRSGMEAFEEGVSEMTDTVHQMSRPLVGVAAQAFVQPAYLAAAPFRFEQFRVRDAATDLFGIPRASTLTFADLCGRIRRCMIADDGKGLQTVLGTDVKSMTFLEILTHLNAFVH